MEDDVEGTQKFVNQLNTCIVSTERKVQCLDD